MFSNELSLLLKSFKYRIESFFNEASITSSESFASWDTIFADFESKGCIPLDVLLTLIKQFWSLNNNIEFPLLKFTLNFLEKIIENSDLLKENKQQIALKFFDIIEFFGQKFYSEKDLIYFKNRDEDFKVKSTSIDLCFSYFEKFLEDMQLNMILYCFEFPIKVSETNLSLHDKASENLSRMIILLFRKIEKFVEEKSSLISLQVKTSLNSGFDKMMSSKSQSESIFKKFDLFGDIIPIDDLKCPSQSVEDCATSVLIECLKDSLRSSHDSYSKYYNSLVSIILYFTTTIINSNANYIGNNFTKILALKQLCFVLDKYHKDIVEKYPTIFYIFAENVVFNLCQILIFFNSPLVDYQYYVFLLILKLTSYYKEELKLQLSAQVSLIVNRIKTLSSSNMAPYLKMERSHQNLLLSLIGFLNSLFSVNGFLAIVYSNNDLVPGKQPTVENMISTITQLATQNVSTELLSTIINFCNIIILSMVNLFPSQNEDSIIQISDFIPLLRSDYNFTSIQEANKTDQKIQSITKDVKARKLEIIRTMDNDQYFDLTRHMFFAENIIPAELGAFLVNKKSYAIMEKFLVNQDMAGVSFSVAVRESLSQVKLSGETSEIQTYMKTIAEVYLKQNPHIDQSKLKFYEALSIGAILLNVNIHSPIKSKKHTPMSFETFCKTFIDHKINKSTIEEVYNSIAKDEIFIPAEQGEIMGLVYDWNKIIRKNPKNQSNVTLTFPCHDIKYELFDLITKQVLSTLLAYMELHPHENVENIPFIFECISNLIDTANKCSLLSFIDLIFQSILNSLQIIRKFDHALDFCINIKSQIAISKINILFMIMKNHALSLRKSRYSLLTLIAQFFNYEMLPKPLITYQDYIRKQTWTHANLNIPFGIEENKSVSYFSKFFGSQDSVYDERSQKESLLLAVKKNIKSKFDEVTLPFSDQYFIIALLNCAINPTKFVSTTESIEILAIKEVRILFADMALQSFKIHYVDVEEIDQNFVDQIIGTLKNLLVDYFAGKGHEYFTNLHLRLIDNLVAIMEILKKNETLSDCIELLIENAPTVKNIATIFSLNAINAINNSNDSVKVKKHTEKIVELIANHEMDDFSYLICEQIYNFLEYTIESGESFEDHLLSSQLNLLSKTAEFNLKLYAPAMELYKAQANGEATGPVEIQSQFLISLQKSMIGLIELCGRIFDKICTNFKEFNYDIAILLSILQIFIDAIVDKRLKVANCAMNSISNCFAKMHAACEPKIIEESFNQCILANFCQLIANNDISLPEELSMRIIQKFCQIYLRYLLRYDLDSKLSHEPMNGILKRLIDIFCTVKFSDVDKQKIFEEAIDQNLLNLMQVIKAESDIKSLKIAIEASNLKELKPNVIEQVFEA